MNVWVFFFCFFFKWNKYNLVINNIINKKYNHHSNRFYYWKKLPNLIKIIKAKMHWQSGDMNNSVGAPLLSFMSSLWYWAACLFTIEGDSNEKQLESATTKDSSQILLQKLAAVLNFSLNVSHFSWLGQ